MFEHGIMEKRGAVFKIQYAYFKKINEKFDKSLTKVSLFDVLKTLNHKHVGM